jgi:hypothetical protein
MSGGIMDIFEDGPIYPAGKRGNISNKGNPDVMNEEFMDSLNGSLSKIAAEMRRANRLKAVELKLRLALQGSHLDPKAVSGFIGDIEDEL